LEVAFRHLFATHSSSIETAMTTSKYFLAYEAILLILSSMQAAALADVTVPAIFGDHMVLQREQANRVWGWAEPGEKVTVGLGEQKHSATADADGRWEVTLEKLPAGGPHEMTIEGKNSIKIADILVGEVWMCSGQSNMEWHVAASDDGDLEKLVGEHPQIRLITVPHVGTQEPQKNFEGKWQTCTPEAAQDFSAVGYYFGKQLAETLDVPIGLIDNAWGGSACESWIRRDRLANDEQLAKLEKFWTDYEKTYDHAKKVAEYEERKKKWEAGDKKDFLGWPPEDQLTSKNRPANIYNGVLLPTIGYGMRGVIWYQGETNADRAFQYRRMFPLMIESWREDWKIGDFPFYWVQLADFKAEAPEPRDSDWAELREAQTMTLDKLPNVGQAVIIDIGEANDIHPRDKRTVAQRLARIALARDYVIDIAYQSPRYKLMRTDGNKIVVTFDVGSNKAAHLKTFDSFEPIGFTIAGDDKKFVPAQAKIVGANEVEVWNDAVTKPVAVRYAWADNPVCNLKNQAGLPATPFRTDDWPGITHAKEVPSL
jgi:sialate O-acetylesterase